MILNQIKSPLSSPRICPYREIVTILKYGFADVLRLVASSDFRNEDATITPLREEDCCPPIPENPRSKN